MLDRYFARIGVAADAPLEALTWAHVRAIPFENLDVLLGRPIRLGLDDIAAKLIDARRGGYCFEQNALFAAVLRARGVAVTTLSARVRWLATGPTPRTHMILAAELPGGTHLIDVGFGGACMTAPLPLHAGAEAEQHLDRYRLVAEGDGLLLQMALEGGWADLYAFTLEPALPIDYEVANHYTSTHPQSRFMHAPGVAIARADHRVTLRGAELAHRRGSTVERRTITSAAEYLDVLAAEFGLAFPPGTTFRGAPT